MEPYPPLSGDSPERHPTAYILDDDVLHLVCRHLYRLSPRTLKCVSVANKQLREAALPFLFRHVKVTGDWLESSAVLYRVNELGMARHVRHFELHVFVHTTTLQRRPPDGLPELLSYLLSDMRCLKHLSLDLPSYHAPLFGNQLRHDRLILRRVRNLTLAPYCEFAIYLCPNVLSVSTNERWVLDTRGNPAMRLFGAAGTSMTIVELAVHVDVWTVTLIEGNESRLGGSTPDNTVSLTSFSAACKALANVLIVTLKGGLKLEAAVSALSRWKRVEKLTIDCPRDLRPSRGQKQSEEMDKLADELLKMILSPPLLVPDELFADGGTVSPFSKATSSASDVLLACKRFMRVATPALYETVIIRTKAQASALQAALTRNPEFGRYVRRLRLEGAYGKQLAKIIPLMPHVSDFCFTLSVYSDDSLAALTTAFTKLQPIRVVLTLVDERRARNKMHATLVSMLCCAIPTWTKLRHFSYAFSSGIYSQCSRELTIADALANNRTVETVDVWNRYWTFGSMPIPVAALLRSASIRTIRLHSDNWGAGISKFMNNCPENVKCRLLFVGNGIGRDGEPECVISSVNPFYQPMQNASRDQRVAVWTRIVSFAVCRETPDPSPRTHSAYMMGFFGSYSSYVNSWFDAKFIDVPAARNFLLVSHEIYDAFLRALSRHLDIRYQASMEQWSSLLCTRPALASHVETLLLDAKSLTLDSDIGTLFQKTSSLRVLDLGALSPSSIYALGRISPEFGSSLRALTLSSRCSGDFDNWATLTFSADVFSGFVALERLEMNIQTPRFIATAPCDFLPNLKELYAQQAHPTFFATLSQFILPKLQVLKLYVPMRRADNFIKKHGPKLVRVETTIGFNQKNLDSCPNLEILDLSDYAQPSFAKSSHRRLQQVRLNWVISRQIGKYKQFCETISPKRFPGLREIVVAPKCEIWPAKERDVNKSSWPPLAEKLSEQGIILKDHSGCTWRPRMQLQ
ncbi:hypothetical protein AURDEDRAFT_187555 [Auricularia subglabra TFB-10046 SS5]|uniref:Uncharacterized protein n=1 Tax=Auricularia subglabra (strain TFB-10046 / SS5) TaxID=717982 RepID=J0D188_AURST|nr:hypothetical protein AURDEDRAFT_187555 [Auricularia subglabra TFB-10046 SS5]